MATWWRCSDRARAEALVGACFVNTHGNDLSSSARETLVRDRPAEKNRGGGGGNGYVLFRMAL